MALTKENYVKRLVDKKIEDYLTVFGAISIEGPKWCGKTWTALNHSNSTVYMDLKENQEKAELSLDLILENTKPQLIDEWNLFPEIWDSVRRKCDETTDKGKYILTCSTKLNDEEAKAKIHHSGAGRIGKINMYTMSLYESGDSTGKASIMDMYEDKLKNQINGEIDVPSLAQLIIRGGWPSNLKTKPSMANILPKSYIDALLDKDIHDDKTRDRNKMHTLLKSLARNESTLVNNNTLLRDIEASELEEDRIKSRTTIDDYINVLTRLHIIEEQNAYSENYRSKERLGKSAKRHFTDPSLACALLDLTKDKLLNDSKTFGFMFEALVERDLRIYMDYLGGKLYHFRDNVTGLEVDSILEFSDSEYAAIEIKLTSKYIEDAKKDLKIFYDNMIKKPKFMAIVVGNIDYIVKDPSTGIYIIPITALKP